MGREQKNCILFSKKYIVKKKKKSTYWGSGFLTSCPKTLSLWTQNNVLLPTCFAKNLESESEVGFLFLRPLSSLLEVFFPVQLQPPQHLHNDKNLQNRPWPVFRLRSATELAQSWFAGAAIKVLYTSPACALGVFSGQKEIHFCLETHTTLLNGGKILLHLLLKVKIWFAIFSTHICRLFPPSQKNFVSSSSHLSKADLLRHLFS